MYSFSPHNFPNANQHQPTIGDLSLMYRAEDLQPYKKQQFLYRAFNGKQDYIEAFSALPHEVKLKFYLLLEELRLSGQMKDREEYQIIINRIANAVKVLKGYSAQPIKQETMEDKINQLCQYQFKKLQISDNKSINNRNQNKFYSNDQQFGEYNSSDPNIQFASPKNTQQTWQWTENNQQTHHQQNNIIRSNYQNQEVMRGIPSFDELYPMAKPKPLYIQPAEVVKFAFTEHNGDEQAYKMSIFDIKLDEDEKEKEKETPRKMDIINSLNNLHQIASVKKDQLEQQNQFQDFQGDSLKNDKNQLKDYMDMKIDFHSIFQTTYKESSQQKETPNIIQNIQTININKDNDNIPKQFQLTGLEILTSPQQPNQISYTPNQILLQFNGINDNNIIDYPINKTDEVWNFQLINPQNNEQKADVKQQEQQDWGKLTENSCVFTPYQSNQNNINQTITELDKSIQESVKKPNKDEQIQISCQINKNYLDSPIKQKEINFQTQYDHEIKSSITQKNTIITEIIPSTIFNKSITNFNHKQTKIDHPLFNNLISQFDVLPISQKLKHNSYEYDNQFYQMVLKWIQALEYGSCQAHIYIKSQLKIIQQIKQLTQMYTRAVEEDQEDKVQQSLRQTKALYASINAQKTKKIVQFYLNQNNITLSYQLAVFVLNSGLSIQHIQKLLPRNTSYNPKTLSSSLTTLYILQITNAINIIPIYTTKLTTYILQEYENYRIILNNLKNLNYQQQNNIQNSTKFNQYVVGLGLISILCKRMVSIIKICSKGGSNLVKVLKVCKQLENYALEHINLKNQKLPILWQSSQNDSIIPDFYTNLMLDCLKNNNSDKLQIIVKENLQKKSICKLCLGCQQVEKYKQNKQSMNVHRECWNLYKQVNIKIQ